MKIANTTGDLARYNMNYPANEAQKRANRLKEIYPYLNIHNAYHTVCKMRSVKDAAEIERLIRGLNPWPSAYTSLNGKNLKIWEAKVSGSESDGEAGTVSSVTKDTISINCGKGQLMLLSVQLEGKKRMNVKDFLLGNRIEKGDVIG